VSRLRPLWWLALLALAALPLLWARWPADAAPAASTGARPLSVERLIEGWRVTDTSTARAETRHAHAGREFDVPAASGMGAHDRGATELNAPIPTTIASNRRPREGGDPDRDAPTQSSALGTHEPSVRVLYARGGDAARDAELWYERDGVVLRQRLDAYSGAATSSPEPARPRFALSPETAAALSLGAWLALTAPWLRRRLRPIACLSANGRVSETWWVVHASQTGQGQQLAEQTAARLRALGVEAELRSIAELDAAGLCAARRLLLVASTTGEGDAPDTAAAFVRRLMSQTLALPELRFAVLALGDRSYRDYCAFGRALEAWLHACAARPLFERIEVDDGDAQAIKSWLQAVESVARSALAAAADAVTLQASPWPAHASVGAEQGGTAAAASVLTPLTVARGNVPGVTRQARSWQRWRLHSRGRLNPHSPAPALWEIELEPILALPSWEPGDVAVLQPLNPPAAVQAWIAARGLDAAEPVDIDGQRTPVGQALRERVLDPWPLPHVPSPNGHADTGIHYSAQSLAAEIEAVERIDLDLLERLPRLPSREYSIASTPASGRLRLIVRQQNHADGRPGLGSRTLLDSPIGSELTLRLRANPGFRLPPSELPLILIGAGSGLAGLLGLLDARVEQGAHANWLLFGERDPRHDCVLGDELQAHLDAGRLQHLDLCFSRDPHAPAYVQDALRAQASRLRDWLARGAHLRLCGSRRGMGEGVHATLIELLGEDAVDALIAAGRYRREVF
jgi:sulfite reductase (NADPH) flavoprotein alpha-component